MGINDTSGTKLILSLLKADIKNNKLILGLAKAGLTADDFDTDLGNIVLDLMGFEKNEDEREEIFGLYDAYMHNLTETDINDFPQRLNNLVLELYAALLAEKKLKERLKHRD